MYILIDRQQMAITHKHSDRVVLAKLSWIECTNAGATMSLSSTRTLLDMFTPSELKLLYKNATGAELKGYANSLAQAVLDVAKRMPETDAVLAEVTAQANLIMDGDKSHYRYVRGAMKPEELPGLFTPAPITVPRIEAEELRAAQNYSGPANFPATGGALPATGGANPAANGTGAATAARAPSTPRAGGTRDVIFRVATEMWQAAGSPTQIPKILELRKTIMATLESAHDIKKTTSSTALGDWQKNILQS